MEYLPLLNIQKVKNGSTRKKFHHSILSLAGASCQFYSPHTHEFSVEIKGNREGIRKVIFGTIINVRSFARRRNSSRFTRSKMKNYGGKSLSKGNICHSNHHSTFTLWIHAGGRKTRRRIHKLKALPLDYKRLLKCETNFYPTRPQPRLLPEVSLRRRNKISFCQFPPLILMLCGGMEQTFTAFLFLSLCVTWIPSSLATRQHQSDDEAQKYARESFVYFFIFQDFAIFFVSLATFLRSIFPSSSWNHEKVSKHSRLMIRRLVFCCHFSETIKTDGN